MNGPSRLEVYAGPMFSGKTELLITRLQGHAGGGTKVAAFKPTLDNRYSIDAIVSHSGARYPAKAISANERVSLIELAETAMAVGIDEVQFFDPWIVQEIKSLLLRGVTVVVSGLDLNCWGEPFGSMPQLLCLADDVHKLSATCGKCGALANRSRRTAESKSDVLVGGQEAYEPACLRCFIG